jgi:hypothetical protein
MRTRASGIEFESDFSVEDDTASTGQKIVPARIRTGNKVPVSLAQRYKFILELVVTLQQVHHFRDAQHCIIVSDDEPSPIFFQSIFRKVFDDGQISVAEIEITFWQIDGSVSRILEVAGNQHVEGSLLPSLLNDLLVGKKYSHQCFHII